MQWWLQPFFLEEGAMGVGQTQVIEGQTSFFFTYLSRLHRVNRGGGQFTTLPWDSNGTPTLP